jgi:hypothetical protein
MTRSDSDSVTDFSQSIPENPFIQLQVRFVNDSDRTTHKHFAYRNAEMYPPSAHFMFAPSFKPFGMVQVIPKLTCVHSVTPCSHRAFRSIRIVVSSFGLSVTWSNNLSIGTRNARDTISIVMQSSSSNPLSRASCRNAIIADMYTSSIQSSHVIEVELFRVHIDFRFRFVRFRVSRTTRYFVASVRRITPLQFCHHLRFRDFVYTVPLAY